ncbi:putative disease resistance protein RGA1 [Bienertia sinuspersici]
MKKKLDTSAYNNQFSFKIDPAPTRSRSRETCSYPTLTKTSRQEVILADKKYLLVLDDLWTEDRHQWCELVKYLTKSKRGSWIVIKTCSQETASVIGGLRYDLHLHHNITLIKIWSISDERLLMDVLEFLLP